MSKIDKLLAVLDMPDCEHLLWMHRNGLISQAYYNYYTAGGVPSQMIFADLAFRLRDEAVNRDTSNWGRAVLKINIKCATSEGYESWWQNYAEPIHWIISSLIAKELSNEANYRS